MNLKGKSPLFVIAIVEAESRVNHRAPFKMLLYIALILDAYEKEVIEKATKEGGGRKRNPTLLKGFKYPPVLPIIFYDGATEWTAATNLLDRTEMHEVFHKYIPKFEYELVDQQKYSVDDLTQFGGLLSLFLILNKVSEPESLQGVLTSLPDAYINNVNVNVPESMRKLLADVVQVLLAKIDVPQDEIDDITERIHERGVPEMFNIENYSVQETRREAKAEGIAEVALNMLQANKPVEEIAQYTGLTHEEI